MRLFCIHVFVYSCAKSPNEEIRLTHREGKRDKEWWLVVVVLIISKTDMEFGITRLLNFHKMQNITWYCTWAYKESDNKQRQQKKTWCELNGTITTYFKFQQLQRLTAHSNWIFLVSFRSFLLLLLGYNKSSRLKWNCVILPANKWWFGMHHPVQVNARSICTRFCGIDMPTNNDMHWWIRVTSVDKILLALECVLGRACVSLTSIQFCRLFKTLQ